MNFIGSMVEKWVMDGSYSSTKYEDHSNRMDIFYFQRMNGLHLPSVILAIIFDSFSIAFISVVLSLVLLTFNYVSIAFALSPFTKNIHTRLLATIGLQV